MGLFGLSLALVTFFAGCAHYQLGTSAAGPDFRSIYIAPVSNLGGTPQVVAPVTRAIRTHFLNDGRAALVNSPESAEVLLDITLVSYSRDFTAVLPTDTALARKFELTLTAKCTLRDQRTGAVLFLDREIKSTRQIFVDGGQNPAEYQVIPQLADQLAERISHAVLDVW